MGGLGYFIKEGKQYQVMGQVARNERDDPTDLKNIYVRNNRSEIISLDNLVRFLKKPLLLPSIILTGINLQLFLQGLHREKHWVMASKQWNRSADKLLDEYFCHSACQVHQGILLKVPAIHCLHSYLHLI